MRRLIKESNEKQDLDLCRRAYQLADDDHSRYSLQLINFIKLKSKIESAIHEGEDMAGRREEIDNLVDTICFGAADQLEKLAEIDSRLKRKRSKPIPPAVESHYQQTQLNIAAQLQDAYNTLTETWENLGEWFDHEALPDSHHPGMSAALEHLKHEQEIVYRVRDRMNTEWSVEFPEMEK